MITNRFFPKYYLLLILSTGIIALQAQELNCAKQVVAPVISESAQKSFVAKRDSAKYIYDNDSTNADAIIWYARRMAYLGYYKEAIALFTKGITLYPNDARFYRHRGHRYLTIRCLDLAAADFEKAAVLIKNKADETEPDGMPNAQNIPTSTLHSNTWYHLGLVKYLQGNFAEAAAAYRNCLTVSSNPDMYVATANWLYITLRRMGRAKEAKKLLNTIDPEVKLIENEDYRNILLLYKQSVPVSKAMQLPDKNTLGGASYAYGMAVYCLLNNEKEWAKKVLQEITAGNQWASFGFIAAEIELSRINK